MKTSALFAGFASLSFAAFAAKTIVVDPAATETETTVNTIERAFELISSQNDTILVRPGTYRLTSMVTNRVKNLVFRSADATTGEIDRENTILDGTDCPKRFFYSKNFATPTINGFTIRNFSGPNAGGAVCMDQGSGAFKVLNCTFEGNHTKNANGGALYSYVNSGCLVSNCVFRSNYVTNDTAQSLGGAVYSQQNGESASMYMKLVDCTFTNNYATGVKISSGGAIYSHRCSHLLGCTFADNWCGASGQSSYGGTLLLGAASTVRGCTFSVRNTSGREKGTVYGRLISLQGGVAHTIDGCTIGPIENMRTADTNGLIYNGGSFDGEEVANSTFKGISVATMNLYQFAPTSVMTGKMRNCLFADNICGSIQTAGASGNAWTYENCTFVTAADGSSIGGASVSTFVNCLGNCTVRNGSTVTTSLFAATKAGCGFVHPGVDYRPAPNSPAVDAGTPLAWHENGLDVGGRPRVVGEAVDLGAYERQTDDPEAYFVRAVASAADKTGVWADAYVGIQPAVDAANDSETILVKAGQYVLTSPVNLQNRNLTLIGEGIDRTVLDAQGQSRCLVGIVSQAGVALSISGMTFANGCAGDDTSDANYKARGGGLYLSCNQSAARIALSNCRVTGCRALRPLGGSGNIPNTSYFCGAGVYAVQYCTFTGCQFDDCIASNAYAAAVGAEGVGTSGARNSGTLFSDCVVTNCSSVGNEGSTGAQTAGIHVFGSSPVWIENTVFSHLKGNKYNNALRVYGGSVVSNCLFRSCKGSYSLCNSQNALTKYIDCTFEKNNVYGVLDSNANCDRCVFLSNSGYVWFQNAPKNVLNCLMVKNAQVYGANTTANQAALFENCTFATNSCVFAPGSGANVKAGFVNCAFWDNKNDVADTSGLATHLTAYTNCYVQAYTTVTLVDSKDCVVGGSPRFVDVVNGDYRLKHSSPLRDKATMRSWMATARDLDHNPRVVTNARTLAQDPNALPDIGCYECIERIPGMLLLVR